MKPLLSLIIPVYNSASTLTDCLDTISQQSYSPFEIIVINDGSTDNSVNIIKTYQQSSQLKITFLNQSHQGPARARNNGAQVAQGEILVFIDADMTFDPDFLDKLTLPIRLNNAKGTFTKEEYVSNWSEPWARFWNYQYTGSLSKCRVPPGYPDTAAVFRAILKSEFDRVNGFDSTGYTDDWTLASKLKYLANSAPGAIIYHRNPATIDEVISQAIWIGKRRYKFGELGRLWALIRANPLFSLLIGLYQAAIVKDYGYLGFKFVYNAGVTGGIIFKWFGGRVDK